LRRCLGLLGLLGRLDVPQRAYALPLRKRLYQKLELLCRKFRLPVKDARDVAAWVRQAFDVATCERIDIGGHHDDRHLWSGRGRRLQRDFGAIGDEDIRLLSHHFVGGGESTRYVFVRAAEFDLEILAVSETKLAELGEKDSITLP
jgi:hypothetical protein